MLDFSRNLEAERRCAGAVILRGYKDLVGTSVSPDDKLAALNWFMSEGTERGSFDSWCRLLDLDPSRYRNQLRNIGLLPCERVARSNHRLERWLRRFFLRDLRRRARHVAEARSESTSDADNAPLGPVEAAPAALVADRLPR